MKRLTGFLVAFLAVVIASCSNDTPPVADAGPAPQSTAKAISNLDATQQKQQQVALAARDALFQQLLGRLTEVLSTEGPAKAIEVCKSDAPRLAREVSEQFGVAIGRTSHRLRNPANAPPSWSQPWVEAQMAEPSFTALPNEQLGALLPIRLKPTCLLCHGPKEQLLDDVAAALGDNYPEDRATGFQEGDLRGWFWVEVPADASP